MPPRHNLPFEKETKQQKTLFWDCPDEEPGVQGGQLAWPRSQQVSSPGGIPAPRGAGIARYSGSYRPSCGLRRRDLPGGSGGPGPGRDSAQRGGASTRRGVPVSPGTGGLRAHREQPRGCRRRRARGWRGLRADRAGASGAASWKRWDLRGQGCGEGRSLLSLPPGSRGRAADALTSWGRGAAPRSLSPPPGSPPGPGPRLRSCVCGGGDCGGGCARRMLGRGRRPGAAQNPLSSPRSRPALPGPPPPPGPERGGLASHGTRCLPGVGSGRQGRAK